LGHDAGGGDGEGYSRGGSLGRGSAVNRRRRGERLDRAPVRQLPPRPVPSRMRRVGQGAGRPSRVRRRLETPCALRQSGSLSSRFN
jgi:hypothetical protein